MPKPDLSKKARDYMKKMQHKQGYQVLFKILDLCSDPFPPDSKKLEQSSTEHRRADAGEFRIIYRVADDRLEVLLVGKRNDDEIYRQLSRR